MLSLLKIISKIPSKMLAKFLKPRSRLLFYPTERPPLSRSHTGSEMNCWRDSERPAPGSSAKEGWWLRGRWQILYQKKKGTESLVLFKSSILLRIFLRVSIHSICFTDCKHGKHGSMDQGLWILALNQNLPMLLTSHYPRSCLGSPQQCEYAIISYNTVTETFKISYKQRKI